MRFKPFRTFKAPANYIEVHTRYLLDVAKMSEGIVNYSGKRLTLEKRFPFGMDLIWELVTLHSVVSSHRLGVKFTPNSPKFT
jgi:hypothetical protein